MLALLPTSMAAGAVAGMCVYTCDLVTTDLYLQSLNVKLRKKKNPSAKRLSKCPQGIAYGSLCRSKLKQRSK